MNALKKVLNYIDGFKQIFRKKIEYIKKLKIIQQ